VKVGWLQDDHGYIGGAEMTAAEFRAAAPGDVEIVDCPPQANAIDYDCDAYVVHNAVQYSTDELAPLAGKPVTKYAHDVFPFSPWGSREWLRENARWVFCSPAQKERMGLEGVCIPPPLDIRANRTQRRNGKREGIVSLSQWRNPGKGGALLAEWAEGYGPVDVFGPGPFIPQGPGINYCGEVAQEDVPELLAGYETFVFLPFDFEPFCRTVAEAHFAGCQVITNDLIGARYWLEENPDGLLNASENFWSVVLSAVPA
jgi:hypothetical protein